MTAAALLARLTARGVLFKALADGSLGMRAPPGAVNDDDRAAIQANKPALVALLTQPSAPTPPAGPTVGLPELPPELERPLAPIPRSRRALEDVVRRMGAASIWSSAMAAEIIVARDELVETFQRDTLGRVVFSLSEVLALPAGMPGDAKRAIYAAKRAGFDVSAVRAPDGVATTGVAAADELHELETDVWPVFDGA